MQPTPVSVEHVVEFSETDAAGLVHFSNYFRYMEKAERVFFARHGIPLMAEDGARLSGFPRVEAACQYVQPLRFGDAVRITLTLVRRGSCALEFTCQFDRQETGQTWTRVASGAFKTVYSEIDRASGRMGARSLPAGWLDDDAPTAPPGPVSG